MEELQKAKEYIELAHMLAPMEKLLHHPNPMALRVFNLDNYKEAYEEQAHYVVKRMKQRKEWEVNMLKPLFIRLKEILNNEKKFK